jgi:enoyl-CoA hydratase/carnithine racemase
MFDTLRKWEQNRHEYAKEWKERTGGKRGRRDRRSILTAETVGQTGPPFDTDRRDRRATGAAGYWDHSEEGLRMTEVTGDQTLLGRGNEQGAGALRATARRIAKRSLRATTAVAHTAAMAAVGKIYVEELMDTEDALEGLNSFLEKRQPTWKHA